MPWKKKIGNKSLARYTSVVWASSYNQLGWSLGTWESFPASGRVRGIVEQCLILSMSNRDQFVHENLPVNLARSWRMQEGAITITKRNEDYPVPNVRCLLFSRILVTSTALFYKIYPVWSLRSSTYAEGNNFFSNST